MTTLYEYYNTGDDSAYGRYGAVWGAQTFTVGANKHMLRSVKLKLFRVGSPGTVTVGIRATDGNGHPTGSDLASGTLDGNALTTNSAGAWYDCVMTDAILVNNATKYAVVIRAPSGNVTNYCAWLTDGSSPTYGDGNFEVSSDSGATWTAYTQYDHMFEVWGDDIIGWNYWKSHVIIHAAGAGTKYQVKIRAHYGAGSDSAGDVYLNSHCRTDFGDVRWTANDQVTLLDYWMEKKVDSDYADFWVEVADDLSTVDKTIWVYYGNAGATTTSDGPKTFLLFDHFDDASLDTTKWTVSVINAGDSVTESGTLLTCICNSTAGSEAKAHSKDKYNIEAADKRRVRWSERPYSQADGYGAYVSGGCFKHADDSVYTLMNNWYNSYRDFVAGNQLNPGTTSPLGSQKTHEATVDGTNTHFYVAGTEQGNSPQATVAKMYLCWDAARGDIGYGAKLEVDWVFVGKFVSPEPANSTWGTEESNVQVISVTDSGTGTDTITSIVETIVTAIPDSGAGTDTVSVAETLTITDAGAGSEVVYFIGEVMIDGLRLDHALTIRVSEPTTVSSKSVSSGLPSRIYLGRQGRTLEIEGWVATVAELNIITALADGVNHDLQLPTGDRVSVHIPDVNPVRPIEPGEYPYTIRAVERMD